MSNGILTPKIVDFRLRKIFTKPDPDDSDDEIQGMEWEY